MPRASRSFWWSTTVRPSAWRFRRMLERMRYKVVEAGCGFEALEIADSQPVDLVLSDWMMPGMDGIELCRAFRALDRDDYGYFILLTAKSDRADVRQAFETRGRRLSAETRRFRGASSAPSNAGERIVRMQRDLARKEPASDKGGRELQTLYAALDRDLDERPARFQQSFLLSFFPLSFSLFFFFFFFLVPERSFRFPDADITPPVPARRPGSVAILSVRIPLSRQAGKWGGLLNGDRRVGSRA